MAVDRMLRYTSTVKALYLVSRNLWTPDKTCLSGVVLDVSRTCTGEVTVNRKLNYIQHCGYCTGYNLWMSGKRRSMRRILPMTMTMCLSGVPFAVGVALAIAIHNSIRLSSTMFSDKHFLKFPRC